jgi:glutamate-1-semialdehyde 2,1-aminomutase
VTRSSELFDRAKRVLPGGVNSPVRAFRAVGGTPFFVAHGHGSSLADVDGREYVDYVCSWGALILGHAHPAVLEAVQKAAERGWTYGAPCEAEVELAEEVRRRMPSLEMMRFVNSGTEATMAAVRLARAATERELIVKFEGCYHGHADSFLVKAGSGVATLGLPDSPGVPAELARLTLTAPFNDARAVADLFREHQSRIAAIIVEPYVGNAGFISPESDFLPALRSLCDQYGALLIFDEVMTGFRVAAGGVGGGGGGGGGGAQQRLDVKPDLTTLGKIVGGGFPVGVYGGRADLMIRVAPEGPVYQAGTLSGNPVAMAAGLATLRETSRPGFYQALEQSTARLITGLRSAAQRHGVPITAGHAGSMWGVYFTEGPVHNYADARKSDTALFARWHKAALARGVFLAPSAFEAGFVSSAHTQADIDFTIAELDAALGEALKR